MSPKHNVSMLESHLGFWLRLVSNAVSISFARRVEAKGVTVAEWVFLRMLYDFERLAPSALAERMAMTKGAITKLAHRLIAKGLVAREANPLDKRSQILALTGKGRALVPELAKAADENDAAFFQVLDARERGEFERLLNRIADASQLKGVPTE